jgi:hypothetical protein
MPKDSNEWQGFWIGVGLVIIALVIAWVLM